MSKSIEGMDDLIRKLQKLPANLAKKAIRQGLREAAKVLQAEAKINAAEGEDATGNLAANIKVRAAKRSRKYIGTDVIQENQDFDHYYGAFQEYGTKKNKPKGFFRRAFDEKNQEAAKVMQNRTMKGIEKSI